MCCPMPEFTSLRLPPGWRTTILWPSASLLGHRLRHP